MGVDQPYEPMLTNANFAIVATSVATKPGAVDQGPDTPRR